MTAAQDPKEVLVLIAPDIELRSVLVGRLCLQGETVITFADAPQFLAAKPAAPQPAVLIFEMGGAEELARSVFAHQPWDLILAVQAPGEAAAPDGAIVPLDHGDALTIPKVLADWRLARRMVE